MVGHVDLSLICNFDVGLTELIGHRSTRGKSNYDLTPTLAEGYLEKPSKVGCI